MKIEWTTVLSVVVAIVIIGAAWMFFTKRKVDANTGEVKTQFSGFGGK